MSKKPDQNDPEYWTPERRHEHKLRGQADSLCRQGKIQEAKDLMALSKLYWPPFPNTPDPYNNDEAGQARARENGKNGGAPAGNQNGVKLFTVASPQDAELLIDNVAQAVATGTFKAQKLAALGPITKKDKEMLVRLTQMPIEEFNSKLMDKLGTFADEVLEVMQRKLREDKFKPGELSFAMMVALQQRQNLDGRSAIANANIGTQVNIFQAGGKTKEEMIASLLPQPKPVIPVKAEEPP